MQTNITSKYYDKTMNYYICSFGGCGSTMLTKYLANFGNAFHIHSRHPPKYLTYPGNWNNVYKQDNKNNEEWFNKTIINPKYLQRFKVIYLYRNPIKAVHSSFQTPRHLYNIQCNREIIPLNQVIQSKKDLYQLESFFDNYTNDSERNYDIISVKYEDFWDNLQEFHETLQIPLDETIVPHKKETQRIYLGVNELNEIYQPLLDKMNKLPPIYCHLASLKNTPQSAVIKRTQPNINNKTRCSPTIALGFTVRGLNK